MIWCFLAGFAPLAASTAIGMTRQNILLVLPETAATPYSRDFLIGFSETITAQWPDTYIRVESMPMHLSAADLRQWAQQRLKPVDYTALVFPSPLEVKLLQAAGSLPAHVPAYTVFHGDPPKGLEALEGLKALKVPDASSPTLHLGLQLFPRVRQVAVLGASSNTAWQSGKFHQQQQSHKAQGIEYEFLDWDGLALSEIHARLRRISRNGLLLLLGPARDDQGQWIFPTNVLASLKQEGIDIPTFSDWGLLFGHGIVGGVLIDSTDLGRGVAQALLADWKHQPWMDLNVDGYLHRKVDERQLLKFNGALDAVPASFALEYHVPTFWEQYGLWAVSAVVLIGVQMLLLVGLLAQKRARTHAEQQARQRLAELARSNRAMTVSRLSLSLAHELSQPLGVVLNSAQVCDRLLQSETTDTEKMRTSVRRILNATGLASGVIKNLRNYIHEGAQDTTSFRLDEWLEQTLELLRYDARRQHVKLMVDVPADKVRVHASWVEYQQILMNLVLNGMEAMADLASSEKALHINGQLHGNHFCLQVDDRGNGLPTQEHDKIFMPFFTTKPNGIGLGLSIVKDLVESHQGSIRVQRTSAAGTCFEWCFPIELTET